MNDMSAVIVPKSDQVTAEDFIAGPRTFTIEGVAINAGTEQPVSIKLAGEPRVFRPCKSMSRVLVGAWGADASKYVGRSFTLYRDPKVKWGGMEVGGIRISHMTDIEREMIMALTATKGKRAPHVVKPLTAPAANKPAPARQSPADWACAAIARIEACETTEELDARRKKDERAMAKLEAEHPDLHKRVEQADTARFIALSAERKPDADHGDGFDGGDMITDDLVEADQ
ncbi:hypothetical protein ABC347_07960 [Sphingomonas sp. 1P06PA]|uniref:hypothetical protein n=1 Tax=Sphingomonas sp. 1P06PA TaxID=554121 RepID=UPI0039A46704